MKYLLGILSVLLSTMTYAQIYTSIDGKVDFVSDAPLEIIRASSDQMQGVLNVGKKTFAFKLYIKSFEGFNNPLQQVHFYENYMEAERYPLATFKGKIIEPISKGSQLYRAKGVFTIHGVPKEKIVDVKLSFKEEKVEYSAINLVKT